MRQIWYTPTNSKTKADKINPKISVIKMNLRTWLNSCQVPSDGVRKPEATIPLADSLRRLCLTYSLSITTECDLMMLSKRASMR